jgi:hypothetical protein
VHLLSSHYLGDMSLDSMSSSANHAYDIWASTTVDVTAIQREALVRSSALRCYASDFFWRPPVDPFFIDPADIPATATNGWPGAAANMAVAQSERTNTFSADVIYILLRVFPTYHARVLDSD